MMFINVIHLSQKMQKKAPSHQLHKLISLQYEKFLSIATVLKSTLQYFALTNWTGLIHAT